MLKTTIWKYIFLNERDKCSYNNIDLFFGTFVLPMFISGELKLLETLDVSCNKLSSLGKC